MPNLIFYRKNESGKILDELDQIYLINLKKNSKNKIHGFDMFYYKSYSNSKRNSEERFIQKGTPFEIMNNNLYFIEIKKSIINLKESYERKKTSNPKKIKVKKKTLYKRDSLTEIGNTIIKVHTFANLIKKITKKKYKLNILFIVDNEFDEEMTKIFALALKRDEIVLKKYWDYNISLIYTQPDLALKHFIQKNYIKNEEIKSLREITAQLKKNLEEQKEIVLKNQTKTNYLSDRNRYISQYHSIDKDVLKCCKDIKSSKLLITVGINDFFNTNHKYSFTSLNTISCIEQDKLDKDYYLIDFATFNYVKFTDVLKSNLVDLALEDYEKDIILCTNFEESYLLVDYVFLSNFEKIFEENIFKNYNIYIYMLENNYFLLHLKKVTKEKPGEIIIYKNKCKNPMLESNSGYLQRKDIGDFIENYYTLLGVRDFFITNKGENYKRAYLFDFQNNINYILDLLINEDKDKSQDYYVEIISVKDEFNFYHDLLEKEFEIIKQKDYKKIIYVKKTEFGEILDKDRIESIIGYLFGISGFKIIDRTKNIPMLNIEKTDGNYNNLSLVKLNYKKYCLPFLIEPNSMINPKNICLIEYCYFILMPLLIPKNTQGKPKILILTNDFGFLNFYFKQFYDDVFEIQSYTEQKDLTLNNQNVFQIDNKNIIIKNFIDLINTRSKTCNSNLNNYDLILLENFGKINETDNMIPNIDVINIVDKILNYNGIFAFNLRTATIGRFINILNDLKKKFGNVKEINIRICSSLVICSQSEIKIKEEYVPDNFFNHEKLKKTFKEEFNEPDFDEETLMN